jgi:hypothetical protein
MPRAFGHGKSDIITLIAGLSRAVPMTNAVVVDCHDMTYARMADLLLFSGLNQDITTKNRCVAGLEALLMISHIANDSVARIRNNLAILGVAFSDDQFKKMRTEAIDEDEIGLRQKIADKFSSLDYAEGTELLTHPTAPARLYS